MEEKEINDIKIVNPFIYRIDPEDYIPITESLFADRKFFTQIDKAQELNDQNLIKEKALSLKRWKNKKSIETEKVFEDFATYKFFYKEVGASLKFNPLSERESGIFILDRILEFLKKYNDLIKPKVVYKYIDVIPDSEGLQVHGTQIHFNSRKLKIFTNHSSIKSEREISPDELVREKAVVYVVTIGPGLDDEVKDLADKGEVFDSYLLNGIGAGAAEMVANDLNLFINDNCIKDNYRYKRLSPGYGDWNITDQEKIFKLLNPEKHIGVKLTDSHIMLPEKSTSGIMGQIIN